MSIYLTTSTSCVSAEKSVVSSTWMTTNLVDLTFSVIWPLTTTSMHFRSLFWKVFHVLLKTVEIILATMKCQGCLSPHFHLCPARQTQTLHKISHSRRGKLGWISFCSPHHCDRKLLACSSHLTGWQCSLGLTSKISTVHMDLGQITFPHLFRQMVHVGDSRKGPGGGVCHQRETEYMGSRTKQWLPYSSLASFSVQTNSIKSSYSISYSNLVMETLIVLNNFL